MHSHVGLYLNPAHNGGRVPRVSINGPNQIFRGGEGCGDGYPGFQLLDLTRFSQVIKVIHMHRLKGLEPAEFRATAILEPAWCSEPLLYWSQPGVQSHCYTGASQVFRATAILEPAWCSEPLLYLSQPGVQSHCYTGASLVFRATAILEPAWCSEPLLYWSQPGFQSHCYTGASQVFRATATLEPARCSEPLLHWIQPGVQGYCYTDTSLSS